MLSKNGINTAAYTTFDAAVDGVEDCTADDGAVLTLLQSIDLGSSFTSVNSGVFTLDLNNCCVTSSAMTVLYLNKGGIDLTVTDSGEVGSLVGTGAYAIYSDEATVRINDGDFIGKSNGLLANGGTITVDGGHLSGGEGGVYASTGASVEVTDGEITATGEGEPYNIFALYANGCTSLNITGGEIIGNGVDYYGDKAMALFTYNTDVNISGGIISGEGIDIYASDTLRLSVGDDGIGATFPNGISITEATLSSIIDENAAYWQGDTMIAPDDDAKEITGGDVVIKTPCPHEDGILENCALLDMQNHEGVYSCCGVTAAEPHNFDSDGICTVCGAGQAMKINMYDEYGDGWNDNAVDVYANDTLLYTVTMTSGEYEQWEQATQSDAVYSFYWHKGGFAYECSFEIIIGDEVVFTATTDECNSFADGQLLYTNCSHSYDDGVYSAPTCTADGGTTYTCTQCGDSYVANEEFALGHDYDDDGACTVCRETAKISISMEDSYGDSWNGNAIEIYADGDLIGTATVESAGGNDDYIPVGTDAPVATRNGTTVVHEPGYSATWSCDYDSEKEYEFYWIRGGYADECSFEIKIADEVVLSADGETCSAYQDGQRIYPAGEGDDIIVKDGTVYVGGVELSAEQYLDHDGNVSELEPVGGFAYFDGAVLTLNNFTYEGAGREIAYTYDGEDYTACALIHAETGELEINLVGTSSLSNPDDETQFYGILLGEISEDITDKTFKLSGSGTLNMSGAQMYLMNADYITIDGGTWNVSAYYGIGSPNGNATMIVNGGELNFAVSGDDWSGCIWISNVTLNDGKLVLSNTDYLALNASHLTVDGGYLEVKQGGMEACSYNGSNMITLGEGVSITSPVGAMIVDGTNQNGLPTQTIANADGTVADAFIIQHESYEEGSGESGWVDNKYYVNGVAVLGWYEIDGSWYYFDEETGYPKTGLSRVPYSEAEIAGKIYAPDADAIAYYEAKGETFIDENEGWFFFHDDGRFPPRLSGMLSTESDDVYMKNGFAEWNPGLVTVDGENYYYFIGDEVNGGNKPAVGNYYVGKNSTDLDITIGGVYTFDENGKLCEYDGITDIDGTLYYYESCQLMLGKGLVEIDGSFYYVRSDGSLVVGQKYWVSNSNGYEIPVGEYEFDEDGKLILPEGGEKHGIYKEDGAWYYYEDGKIALGKYWITNHNDLLPVGMYDFGTDGKLYR